jgi:hypothetical protein
VKISLLVILYEACNATNLLGASGKLDMDEEMIKVERSIIELRKVGL